MRKPVRTLNEAVNELRNRGYSCYGVDYHVKSGTVQAVSCEVDEHGRDYVLKRPLDFGQTKHVIRRMMGLQW